MAEVGEAKRLARKHGVLHKIDPFELESDPGAWLRVLRHLDGLDFPAPVQVKDVMDVDASKYVGTELKKMVVDALHSDYDFGPVEEQLRRNGVADFLKVRDPVPAPPVNRGADLLAHIVDARWVNGAGGALVQLFTRDVDSAHTSLVCVPFNDYFYIKVDQKVTIGDIQKAIKGQDWYLTQKRYNVDENPSLGEHERPLTDLKSVIVDVKVVRDLKSLYGFRPTAQMFVKVTTVSPTVTVSMFNSLSRKNPTWEFFEAKTDLINKFFTKHHLSACAAVLVRHATPSAHNRWSTCDRLVNTSEQKISAVAEGGAPLYKPRMLYYDIECLAQDPDTFPTPDCCPVIQISVLLSDGLDEVERLVLCLKDTPGSPIFHSFDTEEQMLIRFSQIIREWNPDAVAGFNSNNFDMPYIMDRMDALGIASFASMMSRARGHRCTYRRTYKQSKQFGTKEVITYDMPGRLMLDFFEVIKADVTKRLRSYSLKNICATYLGDDNKEDLRYRDIPILFETPEGRARIASYCMQDTALLLELDKKLMLGNNTWALTRVLGVTPDVAVNRGLVHKLMCKLKQYTERFGFVIPTFTEEQKPKFEGKYQGAFVLEPDVGFHEDPVVVCDFCSLYPSLMIYYNLSYDTYVTDSAWMDANPDKWDLMDSGACFVKPEVYFGIIPLLEQELGEQRKAAKKKKAEATDPLERAVWDGEQLAVKVIMNSLYGMLGSPTATVPCVEIAATITAMGRKNLLAVKDYAEANYCRLTGEPEDHPAKVIYGDTDSVFIKMPGVPVERAIKHGKLLEKCFTRDLFNRPNALVCEYEKCFAPFLLVTRKRYAGNKYEFDHNKCTLTVNGMQLVKRDSAVLCVKTMEGFFDKVFKENDKEAAAQFVENTIAKLYADDTPLEFFVLTKKLSKKVEDYTVIPPHVAAWQRMVRRVGKTEAPSIGERFEFVVTRVFKRQKGLGDSMVDYEYAKEHNLVTSIDKDHYFRVAIDQPLRDPMTMILGDDRTNKILNPSNYARTETVAPKRGNILAALGLGPITSKRKINSQPKAPPKKKSRKTTDEKKKV
jgi:DNA polymerase delta subunit 1